GGLSKAPPVPLPRPPRRLFRTGFDTGHTLVPDPKIKCRRGARLSRGRELRLMPHRAVTRPAASVWGRSRRVISALGADRERLTFHTPVEGGHRDTFRACRLHNPDVESWGFGRTAFGLAGLAGMDL